jgi:hypothetical protein
MEPILDNTEKLENSVDITAVQEYYNELKKSRIESEIAAAIDNGNCEKLYEYAVEKKTLIDPGQARIATKYLEILVLINTKIIKWMLLSD